MNLELCEVLPSPRAWAPLALLRERTYARRQAQSCHYLEVAYSRLAHAAPEGLWAPTSEAVRRLLIVHRRQHEELTERVGTTVATRGSHYFSTMYRWAGFGPAYLGNPDRDQFLTLLMIHVAAYQRGRDRYDALLRRSPGFGDMWESFLVDAGNNVRLLSELIRTHYSSPDATLAEQSVCYSEAEVMRAIWAHRGIRVCY